eukprot:5387913-Lingulodinium_polyedra.AAC.1
MPHRQCHGLATSRQPSAGCRHISCNGRVAFDRAWAYGRLHSLPLQLEDAADDPQRSHSGIH